MNKRLKTKDATGTYKAVVETCLISPVAAKHYSAAAERDKATETVQDSGVVRLLGTIVDDEMASLFMDFGETDGFISPKMLRQAVTDADESYILEINSPGGDVFAGAEMMAILKGKAPTEVIVTGIAASMSAMLALSGPKIQMASELSMMMFHAPMGLFQGNASQLQKNVEMLLSVQSSFIELIEARLPNKAKAAIQSAFDSGDDLFLTGKELDDLGITGEMATNIVAIEACQRYRLMTMQQSANQ